MQNYISLDKGIFTLSLDTELAWGTVDKPKALIENIPYYQQSRFVTEKMLRLMEKYNICATWAAVGHLFCSKDEDYMDELDMGIKDERLWYGKDIIKMITECKVPQEIGCHSFNHIIFGHKNTQRELVRTDLKKCLNEAKKIGIQLESFAYPRNDIGYLDEINRAGFKAFRGVQPSWYKSFPRKIQKVCHILDQVFQITPPVNIPAQREGMVDISASMMYLPMNGFRKFIPLGCRIQKVRKGIEQAIKEKKIFHLWFHPFNLATNPQKLLYGLETIFEMVDDQRRKGKIEVKTMRDIAALYK